MVRSAAKNYIDVTVVTSSNQYEELIDRALEANFNLLRIWGGGIVNKEAFYAHCEI